MDYSRPVEIAEEIFWVGEILPEDKFQCHVYLIRNGEESVLLDPGSLLTFEGTLRKIQSLTDPKNIKYLICHHQDPDITACIGDFEKRFPREDRLVVTHWRTAALLKHYAWKMPFWLVDEHDWRLELAGGRTLRFIFTPYAHFPGAICTYDEKTGVLFSSDLFGGFTEKFALFAEDENYFEAVRLFHEHYIPSREILEHALTEMSRFKIEMIAPQHGSIIPRHLVSYFFSKLRTLDCGLFLLSEYNRNLALLSRISRIYQGLIEVIIQEIGLSKVLPHLHKLLKEVLPVEKLLVMAEIEGTLFLYASDSEVSPQRSQNPELCKFYLNLLESLEARTFLFQTIACPPLKLEASPAVILALRPPEHTLSGVGILLLKREGQEEGFEQIFTRIFEKCAAVLGAALEREKKILKLEKERERFYALAVKDPLTGLYNRFYLRMSFEPLFENAKRYHFPFSIIMFDLDHFKKINDIYGHLAGDQVLRETARIILENIRKGDLAVRYGGEEFLVTTPYAGKAEALKIAERVRKAVEQTPIYSEDIEIRVTISAGVAEFAGEKSLEALIKRADQALYEAKKQGRNRVVVAE